MDIRTIDHAGINVRNLETSAGLYERVFGLTIVHKLTSTWLSGGGAIRLGLPSPDSIARRLDGENRSGIVEKGFCRGT
jgi:catechol 2,3-dioxygenase-like lactoylglutathione lyase family enzyme